MIRRSAAFFASFFLLLSLFSQARSGGLVSEHIQAIQSRGVAFEPVELFTPVATSAATDALWSRACYRATVLRFDPTKAADVLGRQPHHISLSVPGANGPVVLDLEKVDITTSDFRVVQASTDLPVRRTASVHYQGMVRGEPGSIAAISVFPDQVMGLLADADGQRVIGRLDNDRDGLHVFYREQDLRGSPGAQCDVREVPGDASHPVPAAPGERTTRCVRFYWEVDNDIFVNKGSVTNATNYVTGLFNQSSIIYANDGIDVALSEVYVWDVTSPYTSNSSGELLDQFGDYRTSFNGDLAHLLAFRGGGGIAWLNTLCNGTRYRMAFSGISSSYSSVPTYSWSVEVVTHEQGHNMASPHTHACSWNGDYTAIDGCGPAAGYVEGTCPAAPVPSSAVGGTIMSYCHLVSAGIKFVNGFGPQPAALIVGRVNAATCLAVCGTSCDPPTGLSANMITVNSANLTWASAGATAYTLQWRLSPSGGWTTVTGLTDSNYALTGLAQETAYDFRVLSECGAEMSTYSAIATFTTVAPCPDFVEPNNSLGTAGAVAVPVSMDALIATAADEDYYSFTVASTSNINMNLSGLAGDYDLELLDAGGTQLSISQNGGTTSEYINFSGAAPGTYYAHVYGYGGAFSATQCYHLYISAQVSSCPTPSGLQAQNITYNSALLSWAELLVVTTFNLRWRRTADVTWTVVSNVQANSYALSGLDPATEYEFEVSSACPGSNAQYSGPKVFTTLEEPCEVTPPIILSISVLLQGPYRVSDGLMVDSLRAADLLPTDEPYTVMGFPVAGPVTVDPAVFTVTGPDAIVDWMLVELRNATDPTVVEETRVGLLQRDGDLTALDGVSPLGFCSNAGNYRVVVRHRNHLGCMSGTYLLSSTATDIDFSLAGTSTYGTNSRKVEGSVMLLWSGNVNGNTTVSYTGAGNDRDPILQALGSSPVTGFISGYWGTDVNMDGKVRYTGANNDRDLILSNIGGSVPSDVVNEQLP
ncbi:MAG TPA: M12 family metallo-peptidase [Flavobacteriales bacterium]|nr:fibronectin type III domain-containing protein [Flavobacteriales bacterium]HQV37549.1 M12 family metallo-peptidase [Flavobacteriales bacterium]HQW33288.1 M12 family metallo-peptidase [Flavobacteriales bacterium]HQY03976.1 M12 family metallo-peptidase [Flavobacteriales bacterium]HQY78835.1 M12 family metallo-peptidase [Flavobacteriales bacterium]